MMSYCFGLDIIEASIIIIYIIKNYNDKLSEGGNSEKSIKDNAVKDSLSTITHNNNDKKLKTINPATEEVLNEYAIVNKEQLNDAVKKSKNAFLEWKENIDKRAEFLYAFAKEFR